MTRARSTEAAPLEVLLKPGEVAARLGVSRSWLYEAAKSGRMPCVRLGGPDGPLRFIESDLVDWVDRARAAWQPGDTARETLRRIGGSSAA
jgi:excisionase family DNA binding protein